jgi:hypothetical protein
LCPQLARHEAKKKKQKNKKNVFSTDDSFSNLWKRKKKIGAKNVAHVDTRKAFGIRLGQQIPALVHVPSAHPFDPNTIPTKYFSNDN